jgi:SAM-dependent methyltransferase
LSIPGPHDTMSGMSDPRLDPDVLAYYRLGGETTRLTGTGEGRLEFLRTQDVLRRLVPEAATVLDVGGATGVHAAWLAGDGHRVHVVDPVPEHVVTAAGLAGVTAEVGDARRLTQSDDGVDVTLLLGPMYHLVTEDDRTRALAEAVRVTRPGGLVIAATVSRFAAWYDKSRLREFPEWARMLERVRDTGVLRDHRGFTGAYLHRPEEIRAEFAAAGLTAPRQFGVEGALWMSAGLDEDLADESHREALLAGLRDMESEPSLLGVSAHVLTAGVVPLG